MNDSPKTRTLNPALRIDRYDDEGKIFVGLRLDTGAPAAFRLTEDSPSPKRPVYETFRRGFKDSKMRTPVGGVIQFDSAAPAGALSDGTPLWTSSWASLLTKDPDASPVLAAVPTRLCELAARGANGDKLARVDVIDRARTRKASFVELPSALDEIATEFKSALGDAAWVFGGLVEARNRQIFARDPARPGSGMLVHLDAGPLAAQLAPLKDSAVVEIAPAAQIFVGAVAKESKRRIAPAFKFVLRDRKTEEGWDVSGFVRCNLVVGRHKIDGNGDDLPEATAQRFLVSVFFAEFPEPADVANVDIGMPDPLALRDARRV
ncbi:MAG: hypothetical protein IBJ15_13350 [Alphaproteobacteria bacterium]|nr:hypothetical protein [Alphaproteobacteria bacterium]